MEQATQWDELDRTGKYQAIMEQARVLLQQAQLTPAQALFAGRIAMRCGAFISAKNFLDEALKHSSAEFADIVRLELGHWSIAARLDLEPAKAWVESLNQEQLKLIPQTPNGAETAWLSNRLIAALAIYKEVEAEHAEQACVRAGVAAEVLLSQGAYRRALAAFLHEAERSPAESCFSMLQEVAERAELLDELDYQASAYLIAVRRHQVAQQPKEASIALAKAEEIYRSIGHEPGVTEVDAQRYTAALTLDNASYKKLESVVERFLTLTHYSGAMNCLMSLSTLSLKRGNSAQASQFNQRLEEIAEQAGARSIKITQGLTKADLATRSNNYRETLSHIDEVLQLQPPNMLRAGAYVQRSVALTALNRMGQALDDMERAKTAYENLNSVEDASELIAKLALDMIASGGETAYDRADQLLANWYDKDIARGARYLAIDKLIGRADLRFDRLNVYRETDETEKGRWLIEAETFLQRAEQEIDTAPAEGVETRAARANLLQRRASVASYHGQHTAMVDAYQQAAGLYQNIHYRFQAANCEYLLGCIYFNRFNSGPGESKADAFGRAEQHLLQAIDYYRNEGRMRAMTVNAVEKLTRLYLAAHSLLPVTEQPRLEQAIEGLISTGLDDLDDVRRAYTAEQRLDAHQGKRAHAKEADALHQLALNFSLNKQHDPAKALGYSSRHKSRILADLMSLDLAAPPTLVEQLAQNEMTADYLHRERALIYNLATATADEIGTTRQALTALYDELAALPAATVYAEVKRGEAPDADDLTQILPVRDPEPVFVEWLPVGNQLWMLLASANGQVDAKPIALSLSDVEEFRKDQLDRYTFRTTLRKPRLLAALDPLISPFAAFEAETPLILCPTGPLNAIPLHALCLAGVSLLERHPVWYTPSLGILRTCQLMERATEASGAAIISALESQHCTSRAMLDRFRQRKDTFLLVNGSVTAQAFVEALQNRLIVHFHGHGEHNPAVPLQSRLLLNDEQGLTAERIFELDRIVTRLIVLGACEGAVSRVNVSDELLGLIPALLAAGISSVVAAGWRVSESTAARFMNVFYDTLLQQNKPLIDALRQAALDLKANPETQSPYHWAAFAGYGDPWRQYTLE